MALWLLCHLALLTFVNCQEQNYATQSENNTTEDTLASLNTTVSDINADNGVGIDEGDGGKADDLADYLRKTFVELISGTADESGSSQDTTNTPSTVDLSNCSVPTVLDSYCEGVPEDVYVYFQYDLSLSGIMASLFTPEIIAALQSNCTPGSWCLPDIFHQDVIRSKSRFYLESPFCSDAMWMCLKTMQDKRINCSDESLNYLISTVILLCDLEGSGDLGQECYARTVETLYVNYADMINPAGSQQLNLTQEDCSGYNVQMTKTYLCADAVCTYDQNVLLEKFQYWDKLVPTAADLAQRCNISRTCQSDYDSDDSKFPYNYYDIFTNSDEYTDDSDEYDGEYYGEDEEELEDGMKQEATEVTDNEIIPEDGENTGNGNTPTPVDSEDTGNEIIPGDSENTGNEIIPEDSEATEQNYDSSEEQDSVRVETVQIGDENGLNTGSNDGYDNGDRTMMLGLTVMTAALLLGFVGLAYVVYKRFQRSRNYKWGYSQLTNQDPRLLQQNDYK